MASVSANEKGWNEYDWPKGGDEWSRRWGGPDYQWWGMLYARVREFVPAPTILEVATGHGRWTRYLVHLCERFIGVDVAESCVEVCRTRFDGHSHASFHKNDGMSLPMAPDGEVDFAFSFDSLVHCEGAVVEAYVHELSRKLTAEGVAFLHHSNLATYLDPETGELPFQAKGWRGKSMSAELFERFCHDADLLCIGQEVIRWREKEHWFRDCFSMLTRPGSRFARENRVIENRDYSAQATTMAGIAAFYGAQGFPQLEEWAAGERALSVLRHPG
jgi:ubiquinone/menaquinone biosynthesis C-methylase UbiE